MGNLVEHIEKDIEDLASTCSINPKRDYLDSKINVNISRAYEKGLINTKEAKTLRSKYTQARELGNKIYNYYKVFDEFDRMCRTRCNILDVVELEDILYCNNLCKTILTFRDDNRREAFLSDYFIEKVCIQLVDKVIKLSSESFSSNELFLSMNNLERLLFTCSNREGLKSLCEKFRDTFLKISLEMIRRNKKYYYSAKTVSGNLKDSKIFTEEDEDIGKNPDNYLGYYIQLALLDYKGDYLSQDMESSVDSIYENIKTLPLSKPNRQLIKSYIDNMCMNYYNSYTEPREFILKFANNNFEFVVGYPESTVVDALELAELFTQTFSLDGLLRYIVNYALQNTVNESRAFSTPEDNFNDAIIHQLNVFKQYDIIDDKQMKIIYDKIRK